MRKIILFSLMGFFASSASFALHCEKEINQVLEVFGEKKLNAQDFVNQRITRSKAAPQAKDLPSSYTAKRLGHEIKIWGATDAQSNGAVVIKVSGKHMNPGQAGGLTPSLPDLEVRLASNCRLEYFSVYDFKPVGTTYTNEPVKVTQDECKKIFSLSAERDSAIFKKLNKSESVQDVYVSRVIPNCRQRSNGSDDVSVSVPVMARLSASADELTKLFPPRPDPDCPNCKRTYRAQ